MTMENPPARKSMSPLIMRDPLPPPTVRQPESARPAAIHPMVPHTLMAPNSFSESFRLIMATELVRARVGA